MNPGISLLQPYPFEKLATLKANYPLQTAKPSIDLSIGEPKHKTPDFILQALQTHLREAAGYPKTRGSDELRDTIASWLNRRYDLPVDTLRGDRNVLPVNGTREALFAFAQCIINPSRGKPLVVMPNPFYQIYEGAALLAGATPYFLNCEQENHFIPDFDAVPDDVWKNCQLVYLCTPGNPAGSVIDREILVRLLELAECHDFVIASDECYAEIYLDENRPPVGLLQAAAGSGRDDYRRCLVFHSLSKRSNVPGMRSGFVAGDANLIQEFLRYRTYHGCAMPGYTQKASMIAWQDEKHVIANRKLYREKFTAVLDILRPVLDTVLPEAGFYLWPRLTMNDTDFTGRLYAHQNITVLPGSYLSRDVNGNNPGANRVRIALVAPLDECVDAANRIREYIDSEKNRKK